jgi:Kef-type K+ transport system membrane component KefB
MTTEMIHELGRLGALGLLAFAAGKLSVRVGQPALLGELAIGIALGPHALGWIEPGLLFDFLMEVGLVLLLLQTGLETDWRRMFHVGGKALRVATTGVFIPWAMGFAFALFQGVAWMGALMIGATLTATSIGITARTLADLRMMNARESQVILGAAVLDDIIGLGVLAGMQGLLAWQQAQGAAATGASPPVWMPLYNGLILGLLLLIGVTVYLRSRWLKQGIQPIRVSLKKKAEGVWQRAMQHSEAGSVLVIASVLTSCWLGQEGLGISIALVAFFMGLLLREKEDDPNTRVVLRHIEAFSALIVPFFFIAIGMQLDVHQLNPLDTAQRGNLYLALALTLIATISKMVSGYSVRDRSLNPLFIGMGMVPRGEVGLIFIQAGRSAGVLNEAWQNILTVSVILTTIIAPVALKRVLANTPPVDDWVEAMETEEHRQKHVYPAQPVEEDAMPFSGEPFIPTEEDDASRHR